MALFDYNLARELGSGSFGTVYLATHKQTKAKFAIKMIEDTNDSTAFQEVEILKKTSHDYIIKYHQSFYSQGKGKLCIVLEFADRGTLESVILNHGSYTKEHNIWRTISHISSALSYLHSLKVLVVNLDSCRNAQHTFFLEIPGFRATQSYCKWLLTYFDQGF